MRKKLAGILLTMLAVLTVCPVYARADIVWGPTIAGHTISPLTILIAVFVLIIVVALMIRRRKR